ncbi:MAG TPA: transglycosylase family protein [Acidimicrobiales bacterium]
MHGGETGVQRRVRHRTSGEDATAVGEDATAVQARTTGEADRIDVPKPLSPMVARQLARRRADRPRHLSQSAADDSAGRLPTGPAAVAFAGVVLLILVVAVLVVAVWPQGGGDDGELVATDVTTTEPRFSGPEEGEGRRAARSPSSTADGDEASATTGSTEGSTTSTGSTGSTGSTSTTGDGTSTTAEPGTSTTGPATSNPSTSQPPNSNPSTSNPPSTGAPSTAPPPASTEPPPSSTTAPSPGDPAQATTWYRLAECETGGNWSYRDGGHYGGLRIRAEDWRDHGGDGYPHQHPAETQITIARRIQADEGWDYWRRCARRLGYM